MAAVDVVVIGGGQAGLTISALLSRRGIEHTVLEREAIAARWRQRWDSFTLVTPNWTIRLPGAEYDGPEPDGFMPRDEIVAYLEAYARSTGAPVRVGIEATEVTARGDGGYHVDTSDGPIDARAVVVATGTFQAARRPAVGPTPSDIMEVHTREYRNPDTLPAGGVLVVGSGQSGAQIAEELHEAGRRVVLSVSGAGRGPRRYRGRDIMRWMQTGAFERSVDALESPAERFDPNPHVSGKRGGHTLNLHEFARNGITLVGHVAGIDGGVVTFKPDHADGLRAADEFAAVLRGMTEKAIVERGIDAPPPDPADDYAGLDGFDQPPIDRVDLAAEGIRTIVWATGYRFDFSWIRPATVDQWGYPVQRIGITDRPGLYFLGLHYLHKLKSGVLLGVGDDAAGIADDIAARVGAGANA